METLMGWAATILLTICAAPQLIKIYKTKSVKDISVWMWWLYLVGHLFALYYSILIEQPPLQLKYGINIAISFVLLVSYYRINYE